MPRKSLRGIALDRSKPASLLSQLCANLKMLIRDGALAAGEPMPSSRDLAAELGVSRNTVVGAYDQLVSEGYLDSQPRSCLYVNELLSPQGKATDAAWKPTTAAAAKLPKLMGPTPFRPCQPDARLFPLALWNRMRTRGLRLHGSALLHYQYRHPLGLPVLRRALATYLRESRGVRCSWEQVAITSGSQQALFLLARVLEIGRGVLIEDPGYLGARAAFQSAGAVLTAVPVDADGIVLPAAGLPQGSVVYTTPSRQFPTGACLPVGRRLALIQAAAEAEAWIIEDDYDSEFRYTGAPVPSLHSLDAVGRTIYIGSMSKVLAPSLRIGYAVLPSALIEPFGVMRTIVDDQGALIEQAALAEFIASGSFYTHIRRCRKEYARRLETFLGAAEQVRLGLRFPNTNGGMNLTGYALEAGRRFPELEGDGLDIPPLSRYRLGSNLEPAGLVFGFTAFDPAAIRVSMRRLAERL
jgi:GntR family transcriptional regulator / MocR family aminotransferase